LERKSFSPRRKAFETILEKSGNYSARESPSPVITTFNPKVLEWARKRAGLDEAALAKKVLGTPEAADEVKQWEETGELTLHRAELLAQKTYTPLGYLFLDKPPKEELPIKDFRTPQGHGIRKPSPALLDVIYQCQRRQAWYREYLISNGAEPLDFVGKSSPQTPVEVTARNIADRIKIGSRISTEIPSWRENLTLHFEAAEEAGILVMRNGVVGNNNRRKLSRDEFRGFALSDEYAPLVFINTRDANAAQVFTFVHEIAHIWIGESAVSNPVRTYAEANNLERYCNAVAAEVLIPLAQVHQNWRATADAEDEIRKIARLYKVSTLVASRRAKDAGFITPTEFKRFYEAEVERYFKSTAGTEGKTEEPGGNFYNSLKARAGDRFCRALIANTLEGKTQYTEAFHLLNLRNTKSFENFARARFSYLMNEIPAR
jgi:Zn-dependent peptidase ImmA (M78 family)